MSEEDNILQFARFRDRQAEWLDGCLRGEGGQVLPVLANALLGVRAQWPDHFAFDEMARVTVLMRPLMAEDTFSCGRRPIRMWAG
jgi:hypothetical protein